MVRFLVFLTILLFSCDKKEPKDTINPTISLQEKYDKYIKLSNEQTNEDNLIYPESCDSLLWNSLWGSQPGNNPDIKLFEDPKAKGKYLRRSIKLGNCYPEGSKSEISRDMFLGLMIYCYKNKIWEPLEDVYQYGIASDWIMGAGEISRTFMTPGMRGTLALIIQKLGGPTHFEASDSLFVPVFFEKARGYEAHLSALHSNLRAEVEGTMPGTTLSVMKAHRDRNPTNPLFHAVVSRWDDGDQAKAIDLLLAETYWPNDRLPTSQEYCDHWVTRRETPSDDWKPCNGLKTVEVYAGGDFLNVAGLVLISPTALK